MPDLESSTSANIHLDKPNRSQTLDHLSYSMEDVCQRVNSRNLNVIDNRQSYTICEEPGALPSHPCSAPQARQPLPCQIRDRPGQDGRIVQRLRALQLNAEFSSIFAKQYIYIKKYFDVITKKTDRLQY